MTNETEDFVFVCKRCGDELGIVYEPATGRKKVIQNITDYAVVYIVWLIGFMMGWAAYGYHYG